MFSDGPACRTTTSIDSDIVQDFVMLGSGLAMQLATPCYVLIPDTGNCTMSHQCSSYNASKHQTKVFEDGETKRSECPSPPCFPPTKMSVSGKRQKHPMIRKTHRRPIWLHGTRHLGAVNSALALRGLLWAACNVRAVLGVGVGKPGLLARGGIPVTRFLGGRSLAII